MNKLIYNATITGTDTNGGFIFGTLFLKEVKVKDALSPYNAYEVKDIFSQESDCTGETSTFYIQHGDNVYNQIKVIADKILGKYTEVDAKGAGVSPEFLDFHEHSEFYSYNHPELEAKRKQCVRGSVIGNCGISVYPIVKDRFELLKRSVLSTLGEWPKDEDGNDVFWKDLKGFKKILKDRGVQNRLYFLTGHAALRIAAMEGNPNREATDSEIGKMCILLEEMIEQGAVGFSTGLYYAPCIFASKKELLSLLKVVAKYNDRCFFAVHIREEGNGVLESLNEVIELSKKAGCRLEISHLKAVGVKNQIKVDAMLYLIEKAKSDGLDVMFDQYPYTYGSTSLFSLLPPDALSLKDEDLKKNMKDKAWREKIKNEMLHPNHFESIAELCTFDNVFIQALGNTDEYNGKSINEIAKLRKDSDSFDTFFDLLLESNDLAVMKDTTTNMDSLIKIYKHPLSIYASDSLYAGKSWHERSAECTMQALRIARECGGGAATFMPNAIYRMTVRGAKRLPNDETKYFSIKKSSIINPVNFDEFKLI